MRTIYDTATELLGKIASESDCGGFAWVHVGQVAWDHCDQLTVSIMGMNTGTPGGGGFSSLPGGRQVVCGPVTVRAQVQRVWCVPVSDSKGNPPTIDAMAQSGSESVWELDALWKATADALRSVDCSGQITGAEALGPEGGLVGWGINIEWTR